jgi:P2 family phage contractile tail tube protein
MRRGIATLNNVFKIYDTETGEALDGTVTLQLPPFALTAGTYKGAGLGAEINVPAPGVMSALQATISCPVIYAALTKYMELGTTRTLDLRNEIVVNDIDSHTLEKVPNRWVLRGPLSGSDPGSIGQAEGSDSTLTIEVYTATHWLDGEEILKWDPFKYIYIVNGKDLMAETRQNILVG